MTDKSDEELDAIWSSIGFRYANEEIDFEEAMEHLAELGFSPSLVHDDNGHWAVSCDGFQDVGDEEGKPSPISIYIFVAQEQWKPTIREALLYFLSKE